MKNPQLEDGYTRIANEIMDNLCHFRIPGELRLVLDCIIRKTYGWNKKEDWISNSQLIEMTKLRKGNVSRSLSKLITHKLVIKTDNKLKLNKNYKMWKGFGVIRTDNNRKVIKTDNRVIKVDNKKLSEVRDTKDIKDTIQKKERANSLSLTKYQLLTLNKKFPDLDIKFELEKANDYLKTEGLVKNDYLAWFRNWLRRSIPDGKVKNGKKVNPIINDPDFKRLLGCDQSTNKGYGRYNAICNTLDNRYPAYKFKTEWEEARRFPKKPNTYEKERKK